MPSANVLSVQALEDLKSALNRYGGEAREALDAAEIEIRRTFDWLEERQNHWQNEVRRRQEAANQARAALARCQASGYRDQQGNYHAPDCSAYEHALLQAQIRLREAEAELRNVQQWKRTIEQAAAEYQAQARRLGVLLGENLPKATALLERSITILHSYTTMAPAFQGIAQDLSPTNATSIPWAEKQAIFKRLENGEPITQEDLNRLQLPISDLQAGALQEDTAWIQGLLDAERYKEAMSDSREATDLRDAILATLKAINYWRSKS